MSQQQERTVEVPVSLIERLEFAADRTSFSAPEACAEVRALLSQLSSTAGQADEKPHAPSCDGWMEDEGDCTCRPSRLASIEDLAPGTRFTAAGVDNIDRRWLVLPDGELYESDVYIVTADWLDPSTIRGVTPLSTSN